MVHGLRCSGLCYHVTVVVFSFLCGLLPTTGFSFVTAHTISYSDEEIGLLVAKNFVIEEERGACRDGGGRGGTGAKAAHVM